MKSWRQLIDEADDFEWDRGNEFKNVLKHQVSCEEAEQVFKDKQLFLSEDSAHSKNENRGRILGKTEKGRLLHVVFTMRGNLVRVISARDMNRKEKEIYEKQT